MLKKQPQGCNTRSGRMRKERRERAHMLVAAVGCGIALMDNNTEGGTEAERDGEDEPVARGGNVDAGGLLQGGAVINGGVGNLVN